MIARVWHGKTPIEKGESYLQFLIEKALPDYKATPGNMGAYVYHEDQGKESHFLTVSYWDCEQSIHNFAGVDIRIAKYYDEDRNYLLEFEPHVHHYHVYQ
jgi:heme-degrading monooxygenase HmoA